MGKEIIIEKEIKWDGECSKWEAKFRVYLKANNDRRIIEVFRNVQRELLGEKLKRDWGDFKEREGSYYRVGETVDYFDDIDEAITHLNDNEIKAIEIISEVAKNNVKQKRKEFSSVHYYTLTEDGEVRGA